MVIVRIARTCQREQEEQERRVGDCGLKGRESWRRGKVEEVKGEGKRGEVREKGGDCVEMERKSRKGDWVGERGWEEETMRLAVGVSGGGEGRSSPRSR
eukprot:106436-Hanusia_phi.AAC.2